MELVIPTPAVGLSAVRTPNFALDGLGKSSSDDGQLKICFVNNGQNTFKLTLQAEMLYHGGNDSVCPVAFCRKKIPKNRSIEDHIRLHLASIFTEVQPGSYNGDDEMFAVEYHCPDAGCKYSDLTNHGFFSRVKYLKQHYLKMHAPKTLKCPSCQKTFAAHSYLRNHQAMCGKSFVCSCGISYSTLEALQTHARRKGHTFDIAKYKELLSDEKGRIVKNNVSDSTLTPVVDASSKSETRSIKSGGSDGNPNRKYPVLLPKARAVTNLAEFRSPAPLLQLGTIIYEMSPSKATIDFGTQTVSQPYSSSHHYYSNAGSSTGHAGPASRKLSSDSSELRVPKRKQSAETQTGRVRVRVSTETQTTNVVKRRRTNRKQQSVEAQTQCQRESPPTATATKVDSYGQSAEAELVSSLKDDSVEVAAATSSAIPYFEGDSFFKEMEEAHIQTQTEPDLFLGGENNFLSDYVVHVDDSDVSNFLNFMTRETQTAHTVQQGWSSFMDLDKADVDISLTNNSSSSVTDDIGCGLTAPVRTNISYLETMDNETQTQLYDFCSIFSKMFE